MMGMAIVIGAAWGAKPETTESTRPRTVFEVGAASVVNDPFQRVYGPQLGLGMEWTPWLRTEAAVGWYPDLGVTNYKPLTRQIIEDNNVSPDLSPILSRGVARATLVPFKVDAPGLKGSIGAEIGIGAVLTNDNLDIIGQENDAEALATETEFHAATSFGMVGELRGANHGVVLRLERTSYVETVSGIEERKNPTWVNVMWTWRP